MVRIYKMFKDKEAQFKFQSELTALIKCTASEDSDAFFPDSLFAIRSVYGASIVNNEMGGEALISEGAFLVVRNALVTLARHALDVDEDFIGEQIGGLVDLLDKAVGDGD